MQAEHTVAPRSYIARIQATIAGWRPGSQSTSSSSAIDGTIADIGLLDLGDRPLGADRQATRALDRPGALAHYLDLERFS